MKHRENQRKWKSEINSFNYQTNKETSAIIKYLFEYQTNNDTSKMHFEYAGEEYKCCHHLIG